MTDVLVVGGGIVGLSVAVHAARGGASVLLVEKDAIGGFATQRSGALVRCHYPDRASAALAVRALWHWERFDELYGGPGGFTRTGFAYVPEASDHEFVARVAMLQEVGVETDLVDGAEIDPALRWGDGERVAYEPRSGYAVPALATATLADAARAAGASLRPGVAAVSLSAGGAELSDGSHVGADATVLCSGAWSAPLAAGVGLELALTPTVVKVAIVSRNVDTHRTVIDAPNGIYFRPDGDDATLVGKRTWMDEPLGSPDDPVPDVDASFTAAALRSLERRLPSASGARVVGSRAGMLDMTPDGLPLVGPTEVPGLWLCCGWSGTGFKTGPSAGEALAEWLLGGERPELLAAFDPARELRAPAGARSPH